MSIYDRKGLMHKRKVITSSYQSLLKDTRRKLSETTFFDQTDSLPVIGEKSPRRDFSRLNQSRLEKSEDVWDGMKIQTEFISISKHSPAVDRLLKKRKTDHENAVENMKRELATSYAACELEFKNRSVSIKIQINGFRKGIKEVKDKLRGMNVNFITSSDSKNYDVAWKEVSALIEEERRTVDRFHERLLNMEKKRRERAKSILQKYYKIFHSISFLLPYEIQVYLENEILNYNEVVLGNHRIYADLRLQMKLLADTAKLKFKHWMEELKVGIDIDSNQ